jgi:Ca2+/H+ antiporter
MHVVEHIENQYIVYVIVTVAFYLFVIVTIVNSHEALFLYNDEKDCNFYEINFIQLAKCVYIYIIKRCRDLKKSVKTLIFID